MAIAKRMAEDFMEQKHHAEAETTTGRGGATSEVQGLAGTDERQVSGIAPHIYATQPPETVRRKST